MIGALFTFEGMWLAHDPTALHSWLHGDTTRPLRL